MIRVTPVTTGKNLIIQKMKIGDIGSIICSYLHQINVDYEHATNLIITTRYAMKFCQYFTLFRLISVTETTTTTPGKY